MKLKRSTVVALILLVACLGCATKGVKTTPQYQAAISVNDFSDALRGASDVEAGLFSAGVVPSGSHANITHIFAQAAKLGKQANAAVAAGDFTSAKQYLQSASALLNGLTPDMLSIKNADSQATMKATVAVAVAILNTWINTLGGVS